MPCAEGDMCLVQATSREGLHGHGCRGEKCGRQLHGIILRGSMIDDNNENHRSVRSTFVDKAGKRKANPAKGAETGQSKRQKRKGGSRSGPRTRLTIEEKVEILQLLDQRATHQHIADRFNCSDRLIRKVKAERQLVEKKAATAGGGGKKTVRRGDFPEVRHKHHCNVVCSGSSLLLGFVGFCPSVAFKQT